MAFRFSVRRLLLLTTLASLGLWAAGRFPELVGRVGYWGLLASPTIGVILAAAGFSRRKVATAVALTLIAVVVWKFVPSSVATFTPSGPTRWDSAVVDYQTQTQAPFLAVVLGAIGLAPWGAGRRRGDPAPAAESPIIPHPAAPRGLTPARLLAGISLAGLFLPLLLVGFWLLAGHC